MVDAAGGRDISDDSMDRISRYYERTAGMGARFVVRTTRLGICSECLVLDDGHIQAIRLDDGDERNLAFALGAAVTQAGRHLANMVRVDT